MSEGGSSCGGRRRHRPRLAVGSGTKERRRIEAINLKMKREIDRREERREKAKERVIVVFCFLLFDSLGLVLPFVFNFVISLVFSFFLEGTKKRPPPTRNGRVSPRGNFTFLSQDSGAAAILLWCTCTWSI